MAFGKPIDILHMVPPVVMRIIKNHLASKYDLRHVKDVVCASAPLGSSTELALKSDFPSNKLNIAQAYGLSETAGLITHSVLHPSTAERDWNIAPTPQGSVGLLFPNTEAMVVDIESKRPLGPNKDGEIWARGPQIMAGYFNNQAATDETIDENGWLHTGDIGHYNSDGYFFIVGRLKELIKYKSFQVAPAELEALILRHPDVDDVGIVGLPDDEVGEIPHAWVVKKPGHHVTEQNISDWVKGQASHYKWLRGGVRFVDSIPRNPTGKVLRREILTALTRSKL